MPRITAIILFGGYWSGIRPVALDARVMSSSMAPLDVCHAILRKVRHLDEQPFNR
jgi:hypothetical protein